ncbi:hypothetical protein Drose_20110 [Dactylosporangium roseum]|uniref:Uncharacterized protein n=1 Tax=Dactylosporangium roseum TaxID=47989 RepID=A0ABY5YV30_9ACTN|nr:hypothetical protein [Dactylosporangium roseum]UWZ33606.1 hypothetical protein Drose_20110 [Dactylosporangium roseum]
MRPRGSSEFGQRLGLAGIAALTGGWFTVSWRVLGKPLVDAVGETVGGVSVVLLGIAVISAARASR